MYICTYILYLSVLKLGSNTGRGSNILRVVQQNKINNYKCLGLFKRRVPTLLNLINIKMVPNLSLFSISLLMFASPLWMLLQLIIYSVFTTFVVFAHRDVFTSFTTLVSQWSLYTFINVLASNHTIKLINIPCECKLKLKSTMWVQITSSYIFANIFCSECSIPIP